MRALGWVAWVLIVLPLALHALATHEQTPGWATDPVINYLPMTGIGPGTSVFLNALIVLGSALAVGLVRIEGKWAAVEAWLVLVGAVGVLIHGLSPVGLNDFEQGSTLLAMIAAAIGIRRLASDELVSRMTLATLLGVGAVVMLDGLGQVTVEHAATVAQYESNREELLAANGWPADSPQARAYERRLYQAEAVGWFGLANVFATVAGAMAVSGLGLALRSRRALPGLVTGAVIALFGVGGLVLSASKGGAGAAVLGGFAAAAVVVSPKVLRELVLPVACGAVIAGLGARGVAGESLGELSLLFRWFYIETTARIFLDLPLFGTGPGDFQAAYAAMKPQIAPETVQSPHSVLFDWAGTLGVFGLAWCAALIGMLGLPRAAIDGEVGDKARAVALRGFAGVAIVSLFASLVIELAATTGVGLAVRAVGGAVWLAVGWVILSARGTVRWACVGLGAVAAVHAMLEVTPVQPGSAVWVGGAIGLACAGRARAGASRFGRGAGAGLAVVAGTFVAAGSVPLWAWQREMDASAVLASMLQADRGPRATPAEVIDGLTRALDDRPGDLSTRTALVGFLLRVGSQTRDGVMLARALEITERGTELLPKRFGAWMNRASALQNVAALTRREDLLAEAAAAYERALPLDVNNPRPAVRLMEIAAERGQVIAAGSWAREALRRSELLRLDPLVGLTEAEAERARGLAAAAERSSGGSG